MPKKIPEEPRKSFAFSDDEEDFFSQGTKIGKKNLFELDYQEEDFATSEIMDFESETMPIDSGHRDAGRLPRSSKTSPPREPSPEGQNRVHEDYSEEE